MIKNQKSLPELNHKLIQNKSNAKSKIQSIRRMSLNPQYNTLKISKQKLLKDFQRNLDQKIFTEEKVKIKFHIQDKNNILKKLQIEEALNYLNKKNQSLMKEVKKFERTMFNKKNQIEFSKDRKQQDQLIKQYLLSLQEKQKLRATKSYLSLLQKQGWNQINTQKLKLSKQIKDNIKQQFAYTNQKKNNYLRKDKTKSALKDNIDKSQQKVVERKKKNESQRKAIGNEYLQQAKKAMQQNVKSKIKMMDINMKCIDYREQLKEFMS